MSLWTLNFRPETIKWGKKLGHGAQAEIFKATYGLDDVVVRRFLDSRHKSARQEIDILQHLTHKHIVQFYHVHDDMIVMEYVEGGNLTEAIAGKALKSWEIKTRIAKDISLGLAYLHSQGIIHCDIKSSNILLTEHKEARICDFVLAMRVGESGGGGTLQWMAPELLQDPPRYTNKSDVYALGMVMWEMASDSTRPYGGHTPDGMIFCILKGILEDIPDKTPDAYAAHIRTCWTLDPDERPTAMDVLPDSVQSSHVQENPVKRAKMDHYYDALKRTFNTRGSVGFRKISKNDDMLRDTKPMDWFESSNSGSGSAKAMFKIGTLYCSGDGDVQIDYDEAMEWYLAASEAGGPVAMLKISQLYKHPHGVKQDDNEAASWYSRAEEAMMNDHGLFNKRVVRHEAGVSRHHAKTMEWFDSAIHLRLRIAALKNSIGVMFHDGSDLYQDYERALEWFLKASDAGDSEAKTNIGFMYRRGHGVEQDNDKAEEWYLKAADGGDTLAMCNVGKLFRYGGEMQDSGRAMEWYLKASDGGNDIAMCNVGGMYETGQGVEQDFDKAMEWYLKASNTGNAGAMTSIGSMYLAGSGFERDYGKAMEWYVKASNAGSTGAMFHIGNMYFTGDGVEKDHEKYLEWYLKAGNAGDAEVMYRIGKMCYAGDVVEKDHEKALEWYVKAGNAGSEAAMYEVGIMYCYGEGVEQDYKKAEYWLAKAACADYDPALGALADFPCDDEVVHQNPDKCMNWQDHLRKFGHPISNGDTTDRPAAKFPLCITYEQQDTQCRCVKKAAVAEYVYHAFILAMHLLAAHSVEENLTNEF
ncbi:hypothetical protein BGZ67_003338 [Mortierella alpina]|nr:hypothetical protein BGZ67_003338 [Mortierella alpina]